MAVKQAAATAGRPAVSSLILELAERHRGTGHGLALTENELLVLMAYAVRGDADAVAAELGIAVCTVRAHLRATRAKFACSDTHQAIYLVTESALGHPEPNRRARTPCVRGNCVLSPAPKSTQAPLVIF
jgi:DNA-binding CsgD family transcriptional regulator